MKQTILVLLIATNTMAQYKSGWDTTRYQKFRSSLIIGLFQSYRNFNNEFSPVSPGDSGAFGHNYIAESKLITGLELTYDKFSLAFGIRSAPQKNSAGKGNTNAFGLKFTFGGNRWLLENTFRSFTGFYDANTPAYDSSGFRERGEYNHHPHFNNTLFRSKFMYFTNNKKYSFRSNYVCNYRQLKSGGTWIFSANTHYNDLRNDSSFFSERSSKFYPGHERLNGLSVFGISTNAGGAFTLVLWKALFAHVMFIVGPEQQWRTYRYVGSPSRNISYFSVSGDIRGSIGLNFKRAYILWTTTNDFAIYDSSFMKLQNRCLGGNFSFGWRFNQPAPEFYRKFQNTKLYSAL